MSKQNSVVVYRDDKRRATVSGCTVPSANVKTGDMLQLAILTDTVDPVTALKTDADKLVCGGCALRKIICYVNIGQMPLAVWRATDGADTVDVDTLPADKPVRLGSYGDPSFLPSRLLYKITRRRKRKWTGYTHQWRTTPKYRARKYARYLMASIDKFGGPIINQITEAKRLGYRYFRVADNLTDGTGWNRVRDNEVACPNFTHKVQCADCGLCNGSTGPDDRRKDIVIPVHGGASGVYQRGVQS
jgi:hypothetical protein